MPESLKPLEDQAAVVRRLSVEIERLSRELAKAHRLLSQSVGWQRDAEIIKAKQAVEIERLQAREKTLTNTATINLSVAKERGAELDKLRKEFDEQWSSALIKERDGLRKEVDELWDHITKIYLGLKPDTPDKVPPLPVRTKE